MKVKDLFKIQQYSSQKINVIIISKTGITIKEMDLNELQWVDDDILLNSDVWLWFIDTFSNKDYDVTIKVYIDMEVKL